jgi:hypothetical protein
MNKDVIYIDTEDDITEIIGKIKGSKEKIVALVPPKRIGVLQSAVNLRLLARAATNAGKNLVLVTNNKALMALTSASMIPVAKNLQSKPEIIQVEELEIDENEDIIDGSQLEVGDMIKISDSTKDDDMTDVIKEVDIDGENEKPSNKKSKNEVKIPNFSSFRKKLAIGIVLALGLAGFLVWAIIYAPSAKIIVTTITSPAPVSATLKLGTIEETDIAKGIIRTTSKQIKKDVSVSFDATGTKDLGNKAVGTMDIERTSISKEPLAIPVGTTFTSGEYVFYSTEAVTLAATEIGIDGLIQDSATIHVEAASGGTGYNLAAKIYKSGVLGISASGSAMTGGTTKMATVVTASDIKKANQILLDLSSEDVKQQLIKQFTTDEVVIADSFSVTRADAVSVPALDTEATGKAKLTSATTFTMLAIAKAEMKLYLNGVYAKQITDKQKVYDDGANDVKLSGFLKTDTGSTINISTIGKVGPNISEEFIINLAKGKRYGDVQSTVGAVSGVSDVDIKFPYFWVTNVPNDDKKIEVQFILKNA